MVRPPLTTGERSHEKKTMITPFQIEYYHIRYCFDGYFGPHPHNPGFLFVRFTYEVNGKKMWGRFQLPEYLGEEDRNSMIRFYVDSMIQEQSY
jgi:hypothetical protein